MLHLRRRDFIAMLGSTAAWSTMAHPAERGPRIGVLTLLSRHDEGGRVADFVAGLRGLGYNEGHNLHIEYRSADGDTARLDPLARELIALTPEPNLCGRTERGACAEQGSAHFADRLPITGRSSA
jgi:hypothetical protein